jgi:hypothetical protein
MFKKFSQAQINQAERKYWLDVRDRGKARFIWRQEFVSVVLWLVIPPGVQTFGTKDHIFSWQFLLSWLITLPIFLLGGYLEGRWKWQDFERKYPG